MMTDVTTSSATNWIALVIGASSLAACATAPPPPVPKVPPRVPATFAAQVNKDPVRADWWRQFGDADLDRIVERTLSENRSFDAAQANIDAARAVLRRTELQSGIGTLTTAAASAGQAAGPGQEVEVTGSAGFGASWEWDAFGRIDAEIRSAAFNVEAVTQARRDVAVIVAAEAADAYVQLRGAQVRLAVAQRNADLQRQSLDLLNELVANGRGTQLDLDRATTLYQTTLASLPLFEATIDASIARLAAVMAIPDQGADALLGSLRTMPSDLPELGSALVSGTPQALVRRRPDIRIAEAELGRALALGDEARARLFPTLIFSADIFGVFAEERDLDDSFGFGIGPALRWEGPDLRRVEADIDLADAQSRAALARYEQTVLNALRDIETALSLYLQEVRRRENLEAAAEAAGRARDLAQFRFEEGLDDFLDVIDAQRTLLDAEDRLQLSRTQAARAAISAYRELGGIWPDTTLEALSQEMRTPS